MEPKIIRWSLETVQIERVEWVKFDKLKKGLIKEGNLVRQSKAESRTQRSIKEKWGASSKNKNQKNLFLNN